MRYLLNAQTLPPALLQQLQAMKSSASSDESPETTPMDVEETDKQDKDGTKAAAVDIPATPAGEGGGIT
jgi:hypothetical protein